MFIFGGLAWLVARNQKKQSQQPEFQQQDQLSATMQSFQTFQTQSIQTPPPPPDDHNQSNYWVCQYCNTVNDKSNYYCSSCQNKKEEYR